jgi:hypothetical protein
VVAAPDGSITAAVGGDLASWRGLQGDETEVVVAAALAPLTGRRHQSAQRLTRTCHLVSFDRTSAPTPVEAWFAIDARTTFLVEYDNPVLVDAESLLAELGEAPLVLTDRRYSLGGLIREHIYPDRGLAVSILEPFAGGPQSAQHVQLFASTTAAAYTLDIGSGPELRPYPPTERPAIG